MGHHMGFYTEQYRRHVRVAHKRSKNFIRKNVYKMDLPADTSFLPPNNRTMAREDQNVKSDIQHAVLICFSDHVKIFAIRHTDDNRKLESNNTLITSYHSHPS